MKPTDKDKSGGTSFWGMFFSITLHAAVIVLVLYWGFSGTSTNNGANGPIEVSLSGIGEGGGGGERDKPPVKAKTPPQEPKKSEPVKTEKEETVKAEPAESPKKEPPKEPEKKVEVKKEEPKKEPEKEESKPEPEVEKKPEKEVVKKAPEKKEVVPAETEKKEEKKPEEPEKEVKKEVVKKPEPTEKPKPEPKKTETAENKDLDKEKSRVIQDIQRQRVLENLKKDTEGSAGSEEEIGEERRLAMADSRKMAEESGSGDGGSVGRPSGGSSVNPVLIQLYTNKVHQRISRNWRIPPGVPTDGGLVSIIFFRVDESGKVYDVRVDKSSGNSAFDQYCVDAIYKSAPLPPPPSEFAEEARQSGVLVPFRNELY